MYEDDEAWQITRGVLAVRLHKLPSEIDDMPIDDVMWLLAVIEEMDKPRG